MRDIEDQIRDLADHSLSLTSPVGFEPGLGAPRPGRRQFWVVAAVVIMLLGLAGALAIARGNDRDVGPVNRTVDPQLLEDAVAFRRDLVNQGGREHLSLTDYVAIAEAACSGAVDDPNTLVALSEKWGLGVYSSDESMASSLWLAARNTCPDSFADQDFSSGPPFLGAGGGATAPDRVELIEPPPEFGDFVDVSILDDVAWRWAEDDQLLMISTTALDAETVVEHFSGAFTSRATVNEVLGPVSGDPQGVTQLWSIDVDFNGWNGVVDITTGAGGAQNDTLVLIAFAPAV